jgi:hypothetical protein
MEILNKAVDLHLDRTNSVSPRMNYYSPKSVGSANGYKVANFCFFISRQRFNKKIKKLFPVVYDNLVYEYTIL